MWRIEVKDKKDIFDAVGFGIKKDIEDLGIKSVSSVHFIQVYMVEAEGLRSDEINRICKELLCDPVIQEYSYRNITSQTSLYDETTPDKYIVEVTYNAGVMDPWEESIKKGISDLGINIDGKFFIKTAKRYTISGRPSSEELTTISEKLLCNKVIQHIVNPKDLYKSYFETVPPDYRFNLIHVDILNADDKRLLKISKDGQLFLNLSEMHSIKNYFKRLKRNPTDVELESLAQTWSEHCCHKTLRGLIEYTEIETANFAPAIKKIDNLLRETIMKVTKELHKGWCVSVFKDNAGIIKFDDKFNICFKVETHNHPSALEPYGGAGTGTGGVIRDSLGTGLGAKPILNTDVFCFGPPDLLYNKLPKAALHPKRIMTGVVSGVRDYGNRMGIPTSNGAILFDEGFTGNPLVFCGNVGIIPKEKSFKKVKAGDFVLLVGGRTGRDGIHGATFSSGELTSESEKISSGAVQIGNPIQEKKMTDCIIKARDLNLYNAITDCGGGGLSSAVGEMFSDTGVEVWLDKVPLKYKGLSYTEIWISEAQERMILSVPKKNIERLIQLFKEEDVEAVLIGRSLTNRRLILKYEDNVVMDLAMKFLHKGLPRIKRDAIWKKQLHKEPSFKEPSNLEKCLLDILSDFDTASKEWVIRQYDHEVQGGSVLKPLVGIYNDGPSDATVVRPRLDSKKGVAVACGINPRYGLIDPYWMAASCIDEAIRQIISVAGTLDRIAILDNFCWGNTDKSDRLGSLVRCAGGAYMAAKGLGTPFISGKDSLNNEYTVDGTSIAIPGTLLISAISVIDDVNNIISMYAKEKDDLIYVVGDTLDELGGSSYFKLHGYIGNRVPKLSIAKSKTIFTKLSKAISKGFVRACHDCSEGGIGVAAGEMAFSGGLGMRLDLRKVASSEEVYRSDHVLFSESNTRFIVEVPKKFKDSFEDILKDCPFGLIGKTTAEELFEVIGLDGRIVISLPIEKLKEAWQRTFRW